MKTDEPTHEQKQVNAESAPDGLIDAPRLLEKVWPNPECRPTLRWLREQQKNRTLPYVKIGRLVWFNADDVMASIRARSIGGVR